MKRFTLSGSIPYGQVFQDLSKKGSHTHPFYGDLFCMGFFKRDLFHLESHKRLDLFYKDLLYIGPHSTRICCMGIQSARDLISLYSIRIIIQGLYSMGIYSIKMHCKKIYSIRIYPIGALFQKDLCLQGGSILQGASLCKTRSYRDSILWGSFL